MVWPARVLALSSAISSCNVTYAMCHTGNKKVSFHGELCSSSLRFLPEHLQRQPFQHFPTPSMSPSRLKTSFSRAPASGYCCTNVWCSDFNIERLFLQNDCIPAPGRPPSCIRYSLLTLFPRVMNVLYVVDPNTLLAHVNNTMFC
jgi:hypothetical protein